MKLKNQVLTTFIALAMMLNGVFNISMGFSQIIASTFFKNLENLSRYADVLQLQEASSLLSVFLGFWLVFLGIGLFRQNYLAWLWSLVLLSISAANSLYPPLSKVDFLISLIFIGVLWVYRHTFSKNRFFMINYRRVVAFLTVIISLIYGVLGSYLLRDQFHGIRSFTDAIYFTLVTYSTLGYGDIYPLTANAKVFVCSMIVVGISAFVATLTLVVAPLIQKRMEGVLNIMDKFHFRNHVLIYGYNSLARHLVQALKKAHLDCLFIARHPAEREEAEAAGFQSFVRNVHSTEDLISLGVQSAKTIVFVSENDADNILGAMAVSQIQKTKSASFPQVIVRVEQEVNIDKAYQAGADLVISASQLAGSNIAEQLLAKF